MADSLAGLVLAAGAGTRLWPLTSLLPKALAPVGDRALVDHALDALVPVAGDVAVNAHHGGHRIGDHLMWRWPGVHLSFERDRALGTAGAVGNLTRWLDGRALMLVNADTFSAADLGDFARRWDGARVCVLSTTPGELGPHSSVVASILPAAVAGRLAAEPSGLWEVVWGPEVAAGRLQTVHSDAETLDCGTPSRYLAANLSWAARHGGSWVHPGATVTSEVQWSVIGDGATVRGRLLRSVVWPGAEVHPGERLVEVVRAGDLTVAAGGPVRR